MHTFEWCIKHKKLLCIDGIGLLIAIFLSVYMQHVVQLQYSQQQAKRWQEDPSIKYHQVSAFMQQDCKIEFETIKEVRARIQEKLIQASYSQDSVSGRLWIDCYVAKTKDSISKLSELGAKGVDEVNIIGVGGDFFLFHTPTLLAGSTFGDKDITQDKLVIDENTAWALFGSSDIAGKTVEIEGKSFVISGVYQVPRDKNEKLAMGKENYIYMDYDTFHTLYPEKAIVSYEAIIPNPVNGFAMIALKEAFGENADQLYADDVMLSFSDKEFLDNTNRFEVWHLMKKLFHMPILLMRTTQVSYPYWENAVRALEWKLQMILSLQILCLLLPVVTIGLLVVILYKNTKENIKLYHKKIIEVVTGYFEQKRKTEWEHKEALQVEQTAHENILPKDKEDDIVKEVE